MKKKVIYIVTVLALFIIILAVFIIYNNLRTDLTWHGIDSHFSIRYFCEEQRAEFKINHDINISKNGQFISKGLVDGITIFEIKGDLNQSKINELYEEVIKYEGFSKNWGRFNESDYNELLVVQLNGYTNKIDFLDRGENIANRDIVDILVSTENVLISKGKCFINISQIENLRKSYNNKINEILENIKKDYISNKKVSFLHFVGLINKGMIPKDSKLEFQDVQRIKIEVAAGAIHPTLLPSIDEMNKMITDGFLSRENGYLDKLLKVDDENGIIPEWYTNDRVPFQWEKIAFRRN